MSRCTCAGNRCRGTTRKLPELPGTATAPLEAARAPRGKAQVWRRGNPTTSPWEAALNLSFQICHMESPLHTPLTRCGAGAELNINAGLLPRPPHSQRSPSLQLTFPRSHWNCILMHPLVGGGEGARGYRGNK